MELVKILHYDPDNFKGLPAFELLMSDGKKYLSHGCEFHRSNKSAIHKIDTVYHGMEYYNKLMATSEISLDKITNAADMFRGSPIKKFYGTLSNCINVNQMFADCVLLESVSLNIPKCEYNESMFVNCFNLNNGEVNGRQYR